MSLPKQLSVALSIRSREQQLLGTQTCLRRTLCSMRMNNEAQRSHNMRCCPVCHPASQLQSTGNVGLLRPLSSFPTCLHSSSSTAWDWPPPSRKASMVLTPAASSPAHSKWYKKPNQTNKAVMFESLKLSPEVTSLKNRQHTISPLSMAPVSQEKPPVESQHFYSNQTQVF